MKNTYQKGFAHLSLLLLVLLILVIGLAGYKVEQNRNSKSDQTGTSTTTAPVTIQKINNASDLNTIQTQLNNESIDSTLNPSSYNADVSGLN